MARPTTSPEKEYERLNPGGGPPGSRKKGPNLIRKPRATMAEGHPRKPERSHEKAEAYSGPRGARACTETERQTLGTNVSKRTARAHSACEHPSALGDYYAGRQHQLSEVFGVGRVRVRTSQRSLFP